MINDTDGWMDGFSGPIPPPRNEPAKRKTSPVIAPWSAGQTQIPVLALCCQHCGSVNVRQRDNGKGEQTVRWECNDCGQSFRILRDDSQRVVPLHGLPP